MKPKRNDNSWLGIMGEGTATLHDRAGRQIGTCWDVPNAVAYAMAVNPEAVEARGLLGVKKRADLADRFQWVLREAHLHERKVRWVSGAPDKNGPSGL